MGLYYWYLGVSLGRIYILRVVSGILDGGFCHREYQSLLIFSLGYENN